METKPKGVPFMKRIISIILALVMVFALCGFTYVRDNDDETLVYTALGDSASNGYGMAEYGNRTYIYGQVVDYAYPALFAKAIGATTFNQDCLSGLRTEDLLCLLDPSYDGDAYSRGTAFGSYVMNSIRNDGIASFEQLSDMYISHVAEADVITVDIGLNNFGNFITTQMDRYNNGNTPYEMVLNSEMLKMLKSPELVALHDQLIASLGDAGNTVGLVELLLKCLVYTYVDNLNCFDALMNRIYELNPDCELYVIGLYDSFPELYITNDMVNIGKLNRMAMQSINAHYAYMAPHSSEYMYVDVINTEIFGLPKNITDSNFMEKFTESNGKNVHPSYAGHEYMFNQLMSKYLAPFSDVCSGNSAIDAIGYVYSNGIMAATRDKHFSPNALVSRGEAANALYVMAGSPDVSGMSEPFTDVKSSTAYYDAIVWAYNNGIMGATTGKLFSPGVSINRSSLSAALYAFAGSPAGSTAAFKDSSLIKSANRNAAAWVVENGIMKASNNYFNPGLVVSRESLAVSLYALAMK